MASDCNDPGDSGGPATCKNDRKSYLFGLTYAKAIAKSKFEFSLGIYLHVPFFVDWILKTMTKEEKASLDYSRNAQQHAQLADSKSKNGICWPRSFPKGCLMGQT
uniref:Peptidase S1 domain-containing protein n=1 Tax=Romanomermis culicivorax TaxID=13658 RepID=A0A915IH56_ROMCU